MGYLEKRDEFGREIEIEVIGRYYVENVDVSVTHTGASITLPSDEIHGVIFNHVPDGITLKANINGYGEMSIKNSGVQLSPFLHLINTLTITTSATSTEKLELIFIK